MERQAWNLNMCKRNVKKRSRYESCLSSIPWADVKATTSAFYLFSKTSHLWSKKRPSQFSHLEESLSRHFLQDVNLVQRRHQVKMKKGGRISFRFATTVCPATPLLHIIIWLPLHSASCWQDGALSETRTEPTTYFWVCRCVVLESRPPPTHLAPQDQARSLCTLLMQHTVNRGCVFKPMKALRRLYTDPETQTENTEWPSSDISSLNLVGASELLFCFVFCIIVLTFHFYSELTRLCSCQLTACLPPLF